MTKDEILNMPAGIDIDTLVAEKVMGKTMPIYVHPDVHIYDEKSTAGNWICCNIFEHGDICEWYPEKFSTDISAAWKVVEKMGDCLHLKQHGSEGNWAAMFCGANDDFVNAETAPEAICKAALLAWRQNERL